MEDVSEIEGKIWPKAVNEKKKRSIENRRFDAGKSFISGVDTNLTPERGK